MAVATSAGTGVINAIEGSGASFVILIAMIIIFRAAAYSTCRLYEKAGIITVGAGFVAVVVGLLALGGLRFG